MPPRRRCRRRRRRSLRPPARPHRDRAHGDGARRGATAHGAARIVKAIVLVGGEGTRLPPLTYATPKPLLPIANQPFLERQLTWLERTGLAEGVPLPRSP